MSKKQGRYFRQKPKHLIGTIYDSDLEKRLHESSLSNAEFHTRKLPYSIEHLYEPDFIYTNDDGIEFIIEAKAIFNDSSEAAKYKWIKKTLKDTQVLVFILEKPNQPIYWQKKRKDGTKMTMKEWCDKNKIMWLSEQEADKLTS